MESYSEVDAVDGFGNFELTNEAIRPFGPAGRVFVPGQPLQKATLFTPKGPATLNLPSPVPTMAQFRALEQAVNANNQRVTAQLAQLTRQTATQGQQGIGMMPLLLIGLMAKNRFDTHVHEEDGDPPLATAEGSDSFSAFLPLLLLQPGLLGSLGGSGPSAPGSQGAISPLLMVLLFTKFLK
jgi:hypothetical protein